MTHDFNEIAGRHAAYTLRFNGEEELIAKYRKVFPPVMPGNEVLIYQWIPARKDKQGNLIETEGLRIVRVPMGKKGPRPDEISRILDEKDFPAEVQLPEALEIPPEIRALKHPAECEVAAAMMRIAIPRGADLPAVHVVLAREANTSVRGKEWLRQKRETNPAAARELEEARK